jgi:hypothetical protein
MITPENIPDSNKQTCSLGHNRIKQAETLIASIQQQIDEAKTLGKDTTGCENLLAQAKEALEKASMYFTGKNCIPANNLAVKAIELLTKSEECIKNAKNLSDNSKYEGSGGNDLSTNGKNQGKSDKDVEIKKIVPKKIEPEEVVFNSQKKNHSSLFFILIIFAAALSLVYLGYRKRVS